MDAGVIPFEDFNFAGEDAFETIVNLAGVFEGVAVYQEAGRPVPGVNPLALR